MNEINKTFCPNAKRMQTFTLKIVALDQGVKLNISAFTKAGETIFGETVFGENIIRKKTNEYSDHFQLMFIPSNSQNNTDPPIFSCSCDVFVSYSCSFFPQSRVFPATNFSSSRCLGASTDWGDGGPRDEIYHATYGHVDNIILLFFGCIHSPLAYNTGALWSLLSESGTDWMPPTPHL